jgi:hypothetical protein
MDLTSMTREQVYIFNRFIAKPSRLGITWHRAVSPQSALAERKVGAVKA